jgi:glyoxylase-like metal-dependent hydrolase (beta-lactamase superfamily II)
MKDGGSLRLGEEVTLNVLATPGHTVKSISIVIFNGEAGNVTGTETEPWAVLTGDTFFVWAGRTCVPQSGGRRRTWPECFYDSLHGKLLALPDATLVYPAHGAGSLCGKSRGSENVSTIGSQRRLNYALQPMSKDQFVRADVCGSA